MTDPAPAARWKRIARGESAADAQALDFKSLTGHCDTISKLSPAMRTAFVQRLADAGVRANRTLCPDLTAQLATRNPIDTVIVNVLDSDPALRFQTFLAQDFPVELTAGVAAVGRIFGAKQTIAVVDADLVADVAATARQACRQLNVQFIRLTNPYPQAHPTLLLHAVLERKLKPARLPTEAGVILLDSPAAIAIGRVVLSNASITTVPVGVYHHPTRTSAYAEVDVGTPVEQVLRAFDIEATRATIFAGDVLRDQPARLSDPIGAGELTFHILTAEANVNPDPCIRCGWCLEVCPTRIHPAGLLDAAQRRDRELGRFFGVDACIECGMCTYVCPSRLPLLQSIRTIPRT